MLCLSAHDLPKCDVAETHASAPPPPEQLQEPSSLGSEAGAAAAPPAAPGGQHLGAEHPLHLTDAIEAGAIAPADFPPRRTDRPGAIDGVEEVQVARPHEKCPVPIEPQLVVRLQVSAQRGAAGRRHTNEVD